MKKNNMIKALVAVMVLVLAFSGFSGCSGSGTQEADANTVGALIVKVNPEFAVNYDLDGNVTSIQARNEDAEKLLADYTGYEGRPSREVIKELVGLMNDAGYFDTDVEGYGQTITIQVDPESQIPAVDFLPDVVTDVKEYFSDKQITGKIAIEGESNYGMSEYAVSDYGETNFKAVKTTVSRDVARYTDYTNTDYDGYNTDYDAKTDYDGKNTDYEKRIGAKTDYDGYNSDYDTKTDYDDANTDYARSSGSSGSSAGASGGNTNYTNYDNYSDYNNSGYGGGSGYDGGS